MSSRDCRAFEVIRVTIDRSSLIVRFVVIVFSGVGLNIMEGPLLEGSLPWPYLRNILGERMS